MDAQHAAHCQSIREAGQELLQACQQLNQTISEKQGALASANARINEFGSALDTAKSALALAQKNLADARYDFQTHPHDQGKQQKVGYCDARYQEAKLTSDGLDQKKTQAVSDRDAIEQRHEQLSAQLTLKQSEFQRRHDEFSGLQCPGSFP